jgi:hypothetical protein
MLPCNLLLRTTFIVDLNLKPTGLRDPGTIMFLSLSVEPKQRNAAGLYDQLYGLAVYLDDLYRVPAGNQYIFFWAELLCGFNMR